MFEIGVAAILEGALALYGESCPLAESDFSDIDARVSGVRMLGGSADAVDRHMLYVTDAQTGGLPAAVCIAPDGFTAAEAHGFLLGAFDRIRSRYEDVLQLICSGSTTGKVFDAMAADLDNPIAFIDDVASIVYQTGSFEGSIKGTIWEAALESGFMDMTFFSENEQSRLVRGVHDRSESIEGRFENDPAHHYIVVPLFDEGVFCGALLTVDVNRPFTPGQREYLRLAGQLTYLEGTRKSARYEVLHGAAHYANFILNGNAMKEGAVARAFERAGWKRNDACIVYRFEIPDFESETYLVNLYGRQIRNTLPKAIWLHYEGALVAVCRKRDFDGTDAEMRKLIGKTLEKTNTRCAVSSCNVGFMNLRAQHIQCELALRVTPEDAEARVVSFDELYPAIVREALGRTIDVSYLCDPDVLRLAQSDDTQDLVRLATLKTYLMNGRSTAAASRALGVHRSTMLYRLEKLEEELGVNLNELDESQLTRLMLSCLLVG